MGHGSHVPKKKTEGGKENESKALKAAADGLGARIRLSLAAQKRSELRVEKVKRGAGFRVFSTGGKVEQPPGTKQQVGARMEGRVIQILVREGSHIQRGQGVLWLDSPKAGELRSDYLRLHALHSLAKTEAERAARLRKEGILSEQALFQSQIGEKRAKIALDQARNALQIYGLRAPQIGQAVDGRLLLRAVGVGHVTQIPASVGQWVGPQNSLIEIEDHKRVWIHLDLPLYMLPLVRVGQEATVQSPNLPQPLRSKIKHIDVNAHAESQTVGARLEIDNSKGILRTGQRVHASIQLNTPSQRVQLSIPDIALQRIGFSTFVFLATEEPTIFRIRSVVAGISLGGKTTVLHGLKEGERVVTQGAFTLKSEMLKDSLGGGH